MHLKYFDTELVISPTIFCEICLKIFLKIDNFFLFSLCKDLIHVKKHFLLCNVQWNTYLDMNRDDAKQFFEKISITESEYNFTKVIFDFNFQMKYHEALF